MFDEIFVMSFKQTILDAMELIFPINFVGHDEWLESDYAVNLAYGDVITRDGEILGRWRVVEYDPELDYASGSYEFIADGQTEVMFQARFESIDSRISRGFALSQITHRIRKWYEYF